MDKVYINDYDTLADIMYKHASHGVTAYAVLFYDEAIELIHGLMDYTEVDVAAIDVGSFEVNGYSKEYVISLSSEMRLFAEPAWRKSDEHTDGGYVWIGSADVIYIDGDASSSILSGVKSDICEVIITNDYYDDSDDDCEVESAVDLSEVLNGIMGDIAFIPIRLSKCGSNKHSKFE